MRSTGFFSALMATFLMTAFGASAEDHRCDYVNRAYENTVNRGRYGISVFQVQPDRSKMLWKEVAFSGRTVTVFLRKKPWTIEIKARTVRELLEDGRPVFTQCHLIKSETVGDKNTAYYLSNWQRGDASATMGIWISVDTKQFVQTRRVFYSDIPDPFEELIEVYSDDL